MPSEPSRSGIVTDEAGDRHIPESVRADGTTRKAIKIKPGYRPPEDVEVYRNRTAQAFRDRGSKGGIPGAEGLKSEVGAAGAGGAAPASSSAASNKNAKRREARKKAKSANEEGDNGNNNTTNNTADAAAAAAEPEPVAAAVVVDPEVEKEKKARNLRKKLKQAKELKSKKEGGESLLPEQIAKVIKINELVRELEALGFDAEGEPVAAPAAAAEKE